MNGICGFGIQNNHIHMWFLSHVADMPPQILYVFADNPQINLSFPRNPLDFVLLMTPNFPLNYNYLGTSYLPH